MQASQNPQPRNRRSVSAFSQQNSKRSSISILNVQDSSILNSHQRQPAANKQTQQSLILAEELLPSLKNKLIQCYRLIRNHVKGKLKDNNLIFTDPQVTQVYQGMSNGLKILQKTVEVANKIKHQLSKPGKNQENFNSSIKNGILQENSQNPIMHKNGVSAFNSFISNSNDQIPSKYLAKIKQLQKQIQDQRQKHSQQIRLMIQNHEEEMMFFEEQQTLKMTALKKDFQQQIDTMLQTHKKKQDEIKSQSLKKLNEMVKSKVQLIRQQQLTKYQNLVLQLNEKQNKYKKAIKSLLGKLSDSKNLCDQLNQKLQENLANTKTILQKMVKTKFNCLQGRNQNFMQILSQKLAHILSENFHSESENIKPPISFANPQLAPMMPYSTMAIQQMFTKSNDSGMDIHNKGVQASLQGMIQQLVCWGFFSQENEENIINLIGISRCKSLEQNFNPTLILSHTLYPLIVEKIKLTLSRFQQQYYINMKQSKNNLINSQGGTPITQFSSGQNVCRLPNNMPRVRYRNIQSIQELEVSDSMICDEQTDEKDRRVVIEGSGNFTSHSPMINYQGYETPEEQENSASFDVDMF